MDSDESVHSESEFNYPDEENYKESGVQNRLESGKDDVVNQVSKIQNYIQSLRPENRKKKATYDLNIWKRFCYSTGEKIERFGKHTSSRTEHSPCRFFMDVRKKDGGEYEPVSLTSLQRSIKRYLNDSGSNINILKDK